MSTTPGKRLRNARLAAGYKTATDAAAALRISRDTYLQHENGTRAFDDEAAKKYAAAFRTTPEHLVFGTEARADGRAVRIIGHVGADPEGTVIYSTGQEGAEVAPVPYAGAPECYALRVRGHSMRGLADDGGLIYFEVQHDPPTPDMLGHVVVLETEDGQVLIKRLLRGERKGLYDLESLNGPTLRNQRIRWAAHVTAIIPPRTARQIIREGMVA